jgi:hypothetical protein
MSYTPPILQTLLSPDTLSRKVLLALEVFDPLSQSLVSSGLGVAATGLGTPIVSLSGRFVWLDEGGAWPSQITVDPVNLPYVPVTVQPPKPPDPANVTGEQRRVRVVLQPTAAADFSSGVTAVRGQLFEATTAPSAPATDATAQLAWYDGGAKAWVPSPELPAPPSETGEFGVFLRLQPTVQQEPDLNGRLLKVRVQFTRGSTTRATPENYPFLADPNAAGRIIDGELLESALRLGWAELVAT